MPDNTKACAACCGLYNVADGTRTALLKRLIDRTQTFRHNDRSVGALLEFEARESTTGNNSRLDDAIHVCEFAGFVDEDLRTPGCMLHPWAPGNDGIDLRGMCHYGSMACRSFYCPAWDELDPIRGRILIATIDDWHLYGLVVVDLEFVNSLFGLLEKSVGCAIDPERLRTSPARQVFREMLTWKNSWPDVSTSTVCRSLYYNKGSSLTSACNEEDLLTSLLQSIESTLDVGLQKTATFKAIQESVAKFCHYY